VHYRSSAWEKNPRKRNAYVIILLHYEFRSRLHEHSLQGCCYSFVFLGYYLRTSLTTYMSHVLLGRYQLNSFPVYLLHLIHNLFYHVSANFPCALIFVCSFFLVRILWRNIPRICLTCMTSPQWVGMVTCWVKGNYWSWRHDVGVVVNSRVGDALVG